MLAYPVLAQLASSYQNGWLAGLAGLDMLVFVYAEPLVRGRLWAWGAVLLALSGICWLAYSKWALLPLLLAPPLFMAMIGWLFARSLLPGQTPLITRIVLALEKVPPEQLEPSLYRYSRGVTLLWASALGVLAVFNLGLAMIAAPRGILLSLGYAPPLTITDAQWSWFANWINYGLIGGVFVVEFAYRKRRFPGRYNSALEFGRKMTSLGPTFWRDLLK
ncbi:ketosynthase [Lysobacteraceae bacterium NML07-0707]|nr:ketosynthase [Xanthomonadaceae bacterium NML07-0707]